MLRLVSETPAPWGRWAATQRDEVLLDHAHCEKKAASTALSLIFRHQDLECLMVPLSELAREELEHFELVLSVLRARGLAFRRQTPSPYAAALMEAVRRSPAERLLDTLLCCALIEARSCERMQRLADALPEPELAELYRGLLASEARHHQTYVDLAQLATGRSGSAVRERLRSLAEHEAAVLAGAPVLARLHAAAPGV